MFIFSNRLIYRGKHETQVIDIDDYYFGSSWGLRRYRWQSKTIRTYARVHCTEYSRGQNHPRSSKEFAWRADGAELYRGGGNDIYTYTFSRASAQGVNYIPVINLFARGFDVNTKKLVILFDKNKVVIKSTMSETQSETKAGVGQ